VGPLVDTSVLIDYFGGARTREADLLEECFTSGLPPATAPIIVQEFLQGFLSPSLLETASLYLSQFDRVPAPDYETHAVAAALHRAGRRKGQTIPTVDSLIVGIARANGLPLLTRDGHQRRLARIADVILA
jgi:predicted nucleic acid-binding protein